MTKKSKENPDIREAIDKIKEFFREDPDMIYAYIATVLASAKIIGEFVLLNNDLEKIPRETQYYLALTWNAYASIYLPEKIIPGSYDTDFQDYFESGGIDERFALVVKQLHQICKEEKLL